MSHPYALVPTQLGTCAVLWSDAGLRRLVLPERSPEQTLARLRERVDGELIEQDPPAALRPLIDALARHLAGEPPRYDHPSLDLTGVTPFRQRVYEALLEVPAGRTVTYGELARLAGSPQAAQAVGQAMASNPLPLVIPCHRVLGANGEPGGFSAYGGVATKAKLLAAEGVPLGGPQGRLPFAGR